MRKSAVRALKSLDTGSSNCKSERIEHLAEPLLLRLAWTDEMRRPEEYDGYDQVKKVVAEVLFDEDFDGLSGIALVNSRTYVPVH